MGQTVPLTVKGAFPHFEYVTLMDVALTNNASSDHRTGGCVAIHGSPLLLIAIVATKKVRDEPVTMQWRSVILGARYAADELKEGRK
jgi:hypothetical protein